MRVAFCSRVFRRGWGSLPPVEMWINFGWLSLGLLLLYFGAEWLVKGSSEIALKIGISPLVVGLTVVAFGTSAPELLVSLKANLKTPPQGDIALGNIVGSNICNIGLILGVGALIRPITVHAQILKREMPLLLVASVVFVAMLWDRSIARWEGGILAAGIVIYVVASIRMARKEPHAEIFEEFSEEEVKEIEKAGAGRILLDALLIVVGLATLIYGADRMVVSGEALARIFGVPEAIIALTLIAFGTSLPELATSIVASIKNQGDIITGNAIGSCMFNLLAVIGIAALVLPLNASELKPSDLWVMLGVTVIVFPFLASGRGLSRAEGAVLLTGYLGYCSWLAFG